jgi:hypothetical protein
MNNDSGRGPDERQRHPGWTSAPRPRRRRLLGLMFALLSIGLLQLVISGRAQATTHADCDAEQTRALNQCVADSCGGVCTLAAWNRCVRIGDNRWFACERFVTPAASMPPGKPPKRRFPGPGILDSEPGLSPQGPSGTGTPGSVPAAPKGPVFR